MNFTSESVREILEIEKIARERINCDAERWLDIACKLDYITIKEKDNIVSLIRRFRLSNLRNALPRFGKKNHLDLIRMREIATNTRFPAKSIMGIMI